jgi:GMP synthase-like glutamine amidotransferase
LKHVIIISCEPGLDEVRNEFGHAIEWIKYASNNSNIRFTSVDAYKSEIPTFDEGDGWIITGSSASVYEDLEWIVELEEAIKRAHETEKPILGICFGHQLIAQALGGVVEKNPKGWELGSYPLKIVDSKSVIFDKIIENDYYYNSHKDVVSKLPIGAYITAENEMGIQGYQIGKQTFGVQFHPEFSHDVINKYVEVRSKMGANVIDSVVRKSQTSHLILGNFFKIL